MAMVERLEDDDVAWRRHVIDLIREQFMQPVKLTR